MSGINKVILIGHIGEQPQFRYLNDHVGVLTFPLATSEFINKNGQKVEVTEWHNILMWRSLADAAASVLVKHSLVYVEGKAKTRSFEDKDGRKKYTTEIIADSFQLLSSSNVPAYSEML